jgi:hypothetical protein
MPRYSWLVLLGLLVAAAPAQSQGKEPRRPPPARLIHIPSETTLERDALTSQRNDFSTNDKAATRQMGRQNKKIDSEVMKGICTGC